MLICQCDQFLCPIMTSLRIPAGILQNRSKAKSEGETHRVVPLVRVRKGFPAPCLRLVWIAQSPERPGQIGAAGDPGVLPVLRGMDLMLVRIVECQALFQVCTSCHEFS